MQYLTEFQTIDNATYSNIYFLIFDVCFFVNMSLWSSIISKLPMVDSFAAYANNAGIKLADANILTFYYSKQNINCMAKYNKWQLYTYTIKNPANSIGH